MKLFSGNSITINDKEYTGVMGFVLSFAVCIFTSAILFSVALMLLSPFILLGLIVYWLVAH